MHGSGHSGTRFNGNHPDDQSVHEVVDTRILADVETPYPIDLGCWFDKDSGMRTER